MAMTTASFRGNAQPTPESLADRKSQLERDLADVTEREKLGRRRELVEQLAGCSLPDATAEQRRLAAAVAAAVVALEEAKRQVRIHDGARTYKAAELQERKKTVLAELVQSCNPRIPAAIAELELQIRQHEHQAEYGVAIATARQVLPALEQLKLLALDDAETAAAIAKILKPIQFA
jgi:hypothetical protein